IILLRKNGKLRLRVKSPLFETFFKEQAKGEIGPPHRLWGVPLYRTQIDPLIDRELMKFGVGFGLQGFWQNLAHEGLQAPCFNVSFLMAQGLTEGREFSLKDNIPLSLVEGPEFQYTTKLKQGLYHILQTFLMDYEATLTIQSDVKI
ncbi:MAG: hypothetical protein ACREIQ_12650, partial [Nitrospiria bacterium]